MTVGRLFWHLQKPPQHLNRHFKLPEVTKSVGFSLGCKEAVKHWDRFLPEAERTKGLFVLQNKTVLTYLTLRFRKLYVFPFTS